jgi:hypothetical protein
MAGRRYQQETELAPPQWCPQEGRGIVDAAATGSSGFSPGGEQHATYEWWEATSMPPRRYTAPAHRPAALGSGVALTSHCLDTGKPDQSAVDQGVLGPRAVTVQSASEG